MKEVAYNGTLYTSIYMYSYVWILQVQLYPHPIKAVYPCVYNTASTYVDTK